MGARMGARSGVSLLGLCGRRLRKGPTKRACMQCSLAGTEGIRGCKKVKDQRGRLRGERGVLMSVPEAIAALKRPRTQNWQIRNKNKPLFSDDY
jgi:hypothetical protein